MPAYQLRCDLRVEVEFAEVVEPAVEAVGVALGER